mmetsp:Transcript_87666/g.165305  ORF Transcript_87666/g.165305 Transcript_87666/m.165305 type:complete len:152 (+) Transcript_87666:556-1011(+)
MVIEPEDAPVAEGAMFGPQRTIKPARATISLLDHDTVDAYKPGGLSLSACLGARDDSRISACRHGHGRQGTRGQENSRGVGPTLVKSLARMQDPGKNPKKKIHAWRNDDEQRPQQAPEIRPNKRALYSKSLLELCWLGPFPDPGRAHLHKG